MPAADERYLLLIDPSDAHRVVYALAFQVPVDRFTGPAVFHPVMLATLDGRNGGFTIDSSGDTVDVAALTTENPRFPDPHRRRSADNWPVYWDLLVPRSHPRLRPS
ncbi:hypothetical protein HDU96_002333 [Phlyctochytrium bullatum]|nr:hypothetical protein HDU96_002333 [Phlyctochytrium bullatum]